MTEAGWYEDPERHGRGRRYWDGSQWTDHYEHPEPAQAAPAPQPVQQQPPAQQLPPAGWKDDPEGGPGMRYWDGQQWTDHYHPPRDAATAQQPAAGGVAAAAVQTPQPAAAEQPGSAAAVPAQERQTSSLDETQLDVRGYHGGRPEEAASEAPAAQSEPIDYGTAGEPATCASCGAKIRSSHKYCPACGVKQANAV